MILIDKYAYKSKLTHINTFQKALFAGIPMLICLVASLNIVNIVTIAFMVCATLLLSGVSAKEYLKLILIPLVFLVLGVIPVIFQTVGSEPVLFGFNIFSVQIGVTSTSANFGLALFLKAYATVSCLYFFILTTPMASVFNLLKKLRIPSIILELMELIYRFIFIILEQAVKIHQAQSSRLGYSTIKNSIKSVGELAGNLFVLSIRRVTNINNGFESRNFSTDYAYIAVKEKNSKGMVFAIIGITAVLIVAILGYFNA